MNRTNTKEPIGSTFDEIRKSQKSVMPVPFPKIETSERTLNPKTGRIAKSRITTKLTSTAFFLLTLNISRFAAMMFSNTAIRVETAAISMNRKNKVPHIDPRYMLENTVVIDTNSRFGPASGLMP
jgi:hypothetical protein